MANREPWRMQQPRMRPPPGSVPYNYYRQPNFRPRFPVNGHGSVNGRHPYDSNFPPRSPAPPFDFRTPPPNASPNPGSSYSGSSSQPPLPAEPPPAKPPPPPTPASEYQQPVLYYPYSPVPVLPYQMQRPPQAWAHNPRFPRADYAHRPMYRPRPPAPASKRKVESDSQSSPEPKKRSMAVCYPEKEWNQEDADKALAAEQQYGNKEARTVIIRFPDKTITDEMIKDLHPALDSVFWQNPRGPRSCFVTIKGTEDITQVMNILNETDFCGMGKLRCEFKAEKAPPEDHGQVVNPYTLYVGNLGHDIAVAKLKEKFPTAQRIDMGYAQRLKRTRYAFVRYQTVEEAIDAFKTNIHTKIDGRSLVIRFRRQNKQALLQQQAKKLSKKELRERKKMLAFSVDCERLKEVVADLVKTEPIDDEPSAGPSTQEFPPDDKKSVLKELINSKGRKNDLDINLQSDDDDDGGRDDLIHDEDDDSDDVDFDVEAARQHGLLVENGANGDSSDSEDNGMEERYHRGDDEEDVPLSVESYRTLRIKTEPVDISNVKTEVKKEEDDLTAEEDMQQIMERLARPDSDSEDDRILLRQNEDDSDSDDEQLQVN